MRKKGGYMTEILEFYKCNICGNFVEVVLPGDGELVCCGQPMEKVKAHNPSEEMVGEKHVPFIQKTDEGFEIRIGSVPHPMEENHYIMFVETNSPDKRFVKRKYLHPSEEPVLKLKCDCDNVVARELCNIHGLWMSEYKETKNE